MWYEVTRSGNDGENVSRDAQDTHGTISCVALLFPADRAKNAEGDGDKDDTRLYANVMRDSPSGPLEHCTTRAQR